MKKLLALLLALVMVFALAACSENDTPEDTGEGGKDSGSSSNTEDSYRIAYTTEEGSFLLMSTEDEPIKFCNGRAYGAVLTDNPDRIFFIEEDTLYYTDLSYPEESYTIAKDVSSFQIAADGMKVFYTKEDDLYVSDLENTTKIAKDVRVFYISPDGESLVYIDLDTQKLYRRSGKDLAEADDLCLGIDSHLYWASDDLGTVIFGEADNLYIQTGSDEPVLVGRDCILLTPPCDEGCFFYCSSDRESLCFYNGETSMEISDEAYRYLSYDLTNCALLFTDEDYELFLATKTEVVRLGTGDITSASFSEDGSRILYIEGSDNLFRAEISDGQFGEPEKMASNACRPAFLPDGTLLYYCYMDDAELALYLDGEKIAEYVSPDSLTYDNDGNLLFYTEDGMQLYNGKELISLGVDNYSHSQQLSDGSLLLFLSAGSDIYTMHFLDGDELVQITEGVHDTFRVPIAH